MTLGTLRDQVIYPDTIEDQRRKGISDDAITDYLDKVSHQDITFTVQETSLVIDLHVNALNQLV